MKQTENQRKAEIRKDFINRIGGGLSDHELISFASGERGLYAGEYNYNEEEKQVAIKYYDISESSSFDENRKERKLPSQVIIGGGYYKIVCQKVEKPKYEIRPYQHKTKVKPTAPGLTLESKIETHLSHTPSSRPKNLTKIKNKEFVRGKSGRRSH
jgi:hypothetical protein